MSLDGYLGVDVSLNMEEEGESVRDYCDLVDERKTDRRRPLG